MRVGHTISTSLKMLGLDLPKLFWTVVRTPRFISDIRRYQAKPLADGHFPLKVRHLKPFLLDYSEQAGDIGGHYFHQDLWAARKIHHARPSRHVDIGSRIDGFVAHVLSFMPVEIIDIRPLTSSIEGLSFLQADASDLSGIPDASIESLSCLHAIEHFGLGRYSDPIDPRAWLHGIHAMQRVVRPGGVLYFSTPIGRERVEFNAHRVFAPQTILDAFDQMQLVSFSGVDDAGRLQANAQPGDFASARSSCGLFEFRKNET